MPGDGMNGAARTEETVGEGFTLTEPPPEDDASTIARLAKLEPLDYDRVREDEAKRMGCRVSTLDAAVATARPKPEAATGRLLALHDPDPWPEAVSLAELLDDVRAAILRHVILSADSATAITLWIAHTWTYARFQHTPRLGVTSPTKRCGKSTLLDILAALSRRPLKADNISAAGTFRLVEALSPLTLLLDEADSFLKENEELRGVLNSGFERSGMVVRVVEVKDEQRPTMFKTFCPVALAAIGKLPGTLEDRAIPIRLARKTAAEATRRLREPGCRAELSDLARKLCRWAQNDESELGNNPTVPAALNDREGDISVPLLAIAEAAGPEWAHRARAALVSVFGSSDGDGERSVMLLADIRTLFLGSSATRMTSADLCRELGEMEDRPWPEWRTGKPITKAQLAVALKPFGIRPTKLRPDGGRPAQGYYREAFEEAWDRYLGLDSHSGLPRGPRITERRNNADTGKGKAENRTGIRESVFRFENEEKRSQEAECSSVLDCNPPDKRKEGSTAWEATI